MKNEKNDLVLLDIGYYGKYILPVKAASSVLAMLVEAGAAKVESEYVQGGGKLYYQTANDIGVKTLDGMYDPTIPMASELRQPYLDWLKTKAELHGPGYVLDTYAAYLAAKEGS